MYPFSDILPSPSTIWRTATRYRLLTCFSLATMTSMASPASAQSDDEDGVEKAYPNTSLIWRSPIIPVCWSDWNSEHEEERLWVREAVQSTWARVSAVNFVGWERCTRSSPRGIRIKVSDEGPHTKGLGTQLAGRAAGMVLNFSFNNWSQSCQGASRQSCIEVIAVHEFGHALAFAHEQNRPDTPSWCDEEKGSSGNLVIGAWDLDSVMNYCNPEWNGDGRLSATDIRAVRRLYGRPKATLSARDKLSVGDFDGNGKEEVLLLGENDLSLLEWRRGALRLREQAKSWISDWKLSSTNRIHSGDVDGDGANDLVLRNSNNIAVVSYSSDEGLHLRSHQHGWVDGWNMGSQDRETLGRFQSAKSDQIAIRSPEWLGLLAFDTRRPGFRAKSIQHDWINGWNMGGHDRSLEGRFRRGQNDQLYVRSPEYATIMRWAGNKFQSDFVKFDWIGGWNLGKHDRELVGDFDGDGREESYVRSDEWAGLFEVNNKDISLRSIQHDWIDGWNLGKGDREFVGRFSRSDRDQLLIRSDNWIGLLEYDPNKNRFRLKTIMHDWVDGWNLGARDRHYIADLDGDGRDEIVVRSDAWIGVMRWKNNALRTVWMAHKSVE